LRKSCFALGDRKGRANSWTFHSVADAKGSATGNCQVVSCCAHPPAKMRFKRRAPAPTEVKNLQPRRAPRQTAIGPSTTQPTASAGMPLRNCHTIRARPEEERPRPQRWLRTRKVWRETRSSNCLRAMLKTFENLARPVFSISIPGDIGGTRRAEGVHHALPNYCVETFSISGSFQPLSNSVERNHWAQPVIITPVLCRSPVKPVLA